MCVCVFARAPVLSMRSSRSVSIAAIQSTPMYSTAVSPIPIFSAALSYVGVRRAPERKSTGCLLNPRNASRDSISTNLASRPGISRRASVSGDYRDICISKERVSAPIY